MNEEQIKKIEDTIQALSRDLNIMKQAMARSATEPTGAVAIADLPAVSAEELAENPQLIFEHATGTKRGYLSQLFEQISSKNIPAAVNSDTAGAGFGGFRYTVSGTALNLFTS